MNSQLFYLVTIFCVAFVISDAAISPEVYWKVKLPNTQIPKVIKDFLPLEDDVRELEQDNATTKKVYYGYSNQLWGSIAWHHAATEDEVRELKFQNPSMNHDIIINNKNDLKDKNFLYKPYFLENYLKKGKIIKFPSFKNKNEAPFFPRQFIESIDPFSSEKISETLNRFSIDSNSKDAKTIEETIKVCEEPEMKEEKKKCVTSLESMVDYMLSVLGTNDIMSITTKVEGENRTLQKYTIEEVEQVADGDHTMVCHKLNYVYAVHYCHVGGSTKTFIVSMVGVDGTKVKAVTICHKDTSFWDPKGLPFVVVDVKPGTTPICHFLQDDQIVFISSKEAT